MLAVFNNRELASATLFCVFILFSMRSESVRSSLVNVLSAFFQKSIVIHLCLFAIYTIGLVLLLEWSGIWNQGQLKNTLMWLFFIGGSQLLNTTNIDNQKQYLRASLNSQLKLIVFVQFLVAFHSYNYFVELVLVSFLTLLACISVVSEREPSHAQVHKLVGITISITGFYLVADSIFYAVENNDKFYSLNTFRDFLVPMLLSVGLLPYTYCFYYFLSYEKAFSLVRIYTDSKQLQRYAKIHSFIKFRGNHVLINEWLRFSCIPEFKSKETISNSILAYQQERRESAV
ncbi:hypothetical protein [Oceanisphaera sp. IT1-181]|uniref:hypothetical protein n=1 Tax=Oceanisphaera sp. IT1-181 TaxID=3081199 RepID=UPI0029CA63E5|nr:hypothetical protein [Oceanisphaera sp. IT1-181]